MPSYRGHLIGGVITYLMMLQLIKHIDPHAHVVIQGLLFCLLGALFPDIDVKSKGQKVFYILLLLFLCYCLIQQRWDLFVAVSLLGIMPLLVRHRGLFHEVWFLLCLTLGIIICLQSCNKLCDALLLGNCSFFFMGCLSHVVLDRVLTKIKRVF